MAGKKMSTLALMVGGHEIWLELLKIQGREIEIGITYGDAMSADGDLDPHMISPRWSLILRGIRSSRHSQQRTSNIL
jgi:hypothetical protein